MKRRLPFDYRLVGSATLMLFILAFFVVSCMREEAPEPSSSKTSRIAQVKAWLAEEYPHTRFTLRWDAVTEQQVGKLVVMDVPLICAPGEYGMNVEVVEQELDERYYRHPVRLELAVDTKHGVAGAFIYTVVPTVAYMEKRDFTYEDVRYHSPQDLTGTIYRYGLYGEPQVMDYFEGGQLRWRRLPLSRTHSAEELDELGKTFMKRMGSDNGSGEWGSCAWETGWCDICGDYHGDDLGEGGISVCRKCGDRYCWGDCWVDPVDWWPDDPAPSVCHTCGRLLDACACNPGEGKEEGPGGNPNPPSNPTPDSSVSQNLRSIMSQNTVLTNEEKLKLSQALDDLIDRCMYRQIYNHLVSNGTSITFTMNPTSQYPASYSPALDKISFQSFTNISAENLSEELFHAYQDIFYPNGLPISSNDGRVNIEFEAKLYADIECNLENRGCPYVLSTDDYFLWIDKITSNGTRLPTRNDLEERSVGGKNYWDFLNDFSQVGVGYNYPPTSQQPDALMLMLQKSTKENGTGCF